MAYSLERLAAGILTHARFSHPGLCDTVDAAEDSPARRELRERIVAAAREVAVA